MITGERKLDLLARADVFCLPSEAEGQSMAVLEALASATPVVLSPGCHFPQAADSGAGIVVSPQAEPLAAALSRLLADRDALERMGRRGRALVKAHYGWDAITDRMIEVYERGIARHRARAG
jgi:glycosyltransferase involved in cell wall biosynthesis